MEWLFGLLLLSALAGSGSNESSASRVQEAPRPQVVSTVGNVSIQYLQTNSIQETRNNSGNNWSRYNISASNSSGTIWANNSTNNRIAVVPQGIISIGNNSFSNSSLNCAIISTSVRTIGAGAFSNNPKLDYISISSNINIGERSFSPGYLRYYINNGRKSGNYVWNGTQWGLKTLQIPQLVGSSGYVIVNTDSLNIRSGPTAEYKIVTTLTRNTRVEVIDRTGSWWKIKYERFEGYANSAYLR